ncbi:MAG: metal ABC transporter substrate-binding protein [Pseudomonadota bacterium]
MKHPMRALLLFTGLALAGPATAAVKIFACEPEWAALATEIGGDRVSIYTATSPLQDPHHIEARPSLIAQVRKADLLVCTGAGLETGWLPVLVARSANPQLTGDRLFFAAEKVARLGVGSGPVDRSKGDVHAEGNPHVHLDPQRLLQIGDALAATLGRIDPAGDAVYRQRAADFRQRLETALAALDLRALRGRSYFVYHDAWQYLFAWLGLVQAGTLEPLPGVPPSAQHLSTLAAQARAKPVQGILHTGYDDRQAVEWLARNAGSCAIELPYTVGGNARATDPVSFYRELVARLQTPCR